MTNGALRIRSSSPNPLLVRGVDFEAHQIHAIRVKAKGSSEKFTRIFWAGPGEHFVAERRIDLIPSDGTDETTSFEGSTTSHPLWRGKIAKLRLDTNAKPGRRVEISEVTGVRYEVEVGTLQEEADQAWKVDIDNDLRNVLLAPPGRVLERDILLPPQAELRFALGLLRGATMVTGSEESGRASGGARFQIRLRGFAAEAVTVFDDTMPLPQVMEDFRWQEHTVDLSAHAGQQVHLAFETSASNGGSVSGMPVWATPEIVSRGSRPALPNVVLISIDTLRADRLSLNGYSRPTSPRIDAWAHRAGINFTHAIAPAPWTLPSHVSLFTGQDAMRHGVNHQRPVPSELTLLAERLREAGYATLGVTGGVLLRPEFGFAQGFDSYRYWSDHATEQNELARGVERALDLLERHAGRPVFLFFHTYEVHTPYRAREPFYGRFETRKLEDPGVQVRPRLRDPSPEDGMRRIHELMWRRSPTSDQEPLPADLLPLLTTLYDSGIAYTDEHVGRFLERLGESDLADRTLVVLTSDHGESLGEQGRAGHASLYDENLRIPLIVSYPGVLPAGEEVERQVRTVDVLPTILDLVGLPVPEDIDGISLRPLIDDEGGAPPREAWSYASHTNRGVSLRVEGSYKYIFHNSAWPPFAGRDELYHLLDDPEERENLAATKPSVARSFRERVRRALSQGQGLWIRFSNDGEGYVRGSLHSAKLGDTKVKAIDLPEGALQWESRDVGFSVAAGVSYTLMLEEPGPAPLNFSGSWRSADNSEELPFHWEVDPTALRSRRSLALDSGRNGAAITVWWQGSRSGETSPPVDETGALRQELEALGYVRH